jgi:hypothetical protein
MESYLVGLAKHKVNCCQCGQSLIGSNNLNIFETSIPASWRFPRSAENKAVALLCDECQGGGIIIPEYVVEASPGYGKVTYHKIRRAELCAG